VERQTAQKIIDGAATGNNFLKHSILFALETFLSEKLGQTILQEAAYVSQLDADGAKEETLVS